MNLQDELDAIMDSDEFTFFETELFSENALYLEDWDSLLSFARQQGATSLFYMFEYYFEEDYRISGEHLRGWDQRLLEALGPKIREHNEEVAAYDFTRPCALFLFCLYEGFAVIAELEDDWLDGEGLETAETVLGGWARESQGLFQQIQTERDQERQQLITRLTGYILRDPEFYKCTSQKLRLRYITGLIRRAPAYRTAFRNQFEYAAYIDAIWKEYESSR